MDCRVGFEVIFRVIVTGTSVVTMLLIKGLLVWRLGMAETCVSSLSTAAVNSSDMG
jgi:hypothetical protein